MIGAPSPLLFNRGTLAALLYFKMTVVSQSKSQETNQEVTTVNLLRGDDDVD